MPPFNVTHKLRRTQTQNRKRAIHGDPGTGKLKQRVPPVSVSGKRKRKLFKKWRREQKEAMQKGLITMEDVEMAVVEGTSQNSNEKPQMKFHLKKGSKLRIKKLKGKGKMKAKSAKTPTEGSTDAMVE